VVGRTRSVAGPRTTGSGHEWARSPMRIAIAAPYPPFDGVPHAGGAYLHAYITYLSQNHKVDLICTTKPEPRTVSTYDGSVGVHFARPLEVGGTSRIRLQARTLTGFNIRAPEVDGLISDPHARAVLAAADIVDIQWAELLRALPVVRRDRGRKPIVVTEHDLFARGMVRLARSQSGTVEPIPFRKRIFAPFAIFAETYFLTKSDLVQLFNRDDIRLLRRCGLRRPCAVLDPLIDPSPEALISERSNKVIFAAAFARGPNAEGATWFLRKVWPGVLRSFPGATVVLAGSGSAEALAACPAPGASATGYLPDLKAAYTGCAVAVAPLLRGAGLKFKVPQALAYGLPVVTTSVGAEGMPPACPAVVANSAPDMAHAVVSLLKSPDRARELGAEGRAWVASAFDFSRSMEEVERRFGALVQRGAR
jgi:glycosyltransferase involved in cell wall biosynthesis